ncbi:MAG TPA: Shedu anti-phage system protein SduA domain-containing protein [Solirubrobacterales bacterium]|jgi:hypothetical protein|nr:Shedu anti-phage system protein SduA domain-containing protein [Solirubrobacterales bacterium]
MSKLEFSAEDRFAVANIATPELAPHPFTVGIVSQSAVGLRNWQMVWDLRQLDGYTVYEDILDALDEAISYERGAPILYVAPEKVESIEAGLMRFKKTKPLILPTRNKPLPKRPLDLAPFTDGWSGSQDGTGLTPLLDVDNELNADRMRATLRDDGRVAAEIGLIPSHREAEEMVDAILDDQGFLDAYSKVLDDVQSEREQLLSTFLEGIASHSLLSEVALTMKGDWIQVVPMHAGALYELDTGSESLLVRPARSGQGAHWQRFASAISELEYLINEPDVDESAIEELLTRNPLFLRGLNYTQAYHQVVLPLGDGRHYKPDIIAEPADSDWWDIIDIKLPKEKIFVGRPGRIGISGAIREAASQLREYARWFDGGSVAKRVEERYKIRCHEPKQVVIIGRDPREFSEEQRRAARSAHPNLEIVTYDGLLKAAKNQLLF